MSAHLSSNKDPHSLVYEARQMAGGIAVLASHVDGKIDGLEGEQLYFLLSSLGEKLDLALTKMEEE